MFKRDERGGQPDSARTESARPAPPPTSPPPAASSGGTQFGSRASSAPTVTNDGNRPREESVISAHLRVVGNLESEDDIQIRGRVDGDIRCRTLTVAENATVDGAIEAETVQINGSIKGQIAAEKVRIAATGRMEGDIAYQTLAMEEGAVVEGQVHRMAPQKTAETKPGDAKASAASAKSTAATANGGAGSNGNGASDAAAGKYVSDGPSPAPAKAGS